MIGGSRKVGPPIGRDSYRSATASAGRFERGRDRVSTGPGEMPGRRQARGANTSGGETAEPGPARPSPRSGGPAAARGPGSASPGPRPPWRSARSSASRSHRTLPGPRRRGRPPTIGRASPDHAVRPIGRRHGGRSDGPSRSGEDRAGRTAVCSPARPRRRPGSGSGQGMTWPGGARSSSHPICEDARPTNEESLSIIRHARGFGPAKSRNYRPGASRKKPSGRGLASPAGLDKEVSVLARAISRSRRPGRGPRRGRRGRW